MARAIDADELKKSLIGVDIESDMDVVFADTYDQTNLFEIIDEAPTIEPKQEWISVKDKKPEVGVRVMVCGKRGGINIGRLDYPEDEYICVEKGHCYRGYTHWMPLPEPPKEL